MEGTARWLTLKLQKCVLAGDSGVAVRKISSFSVVLISTLIFSGVFAIIWQSYPGSLLGNVGLFVGMYGIAFLTGHIIQSTTRIVYYLQRRARHIWGANIPPYTPSSLTSPQKTHVVNPYSIAHRRFKRQSLHSVVLFSLTLLLAAGIVSTRPAIITWLSDWWIVEAVGVFALLLLRIPIAIFEVSPFDFPPVRGEYNSTVLVLLGLNLLTTTPMSGNLSWLIESKIESTFEALLFEGKASLQQIVGLTWTLASVIYTASAIFFILFPRL